MKLDSPASTGRAAHGKYQPPYGLLRRESLCSFEPPSCRDFEVEDCQTFISHDEQKFYDWCLGTLEDSGVVGILKNERLYLASECLADLVVGDTTYEVELSQTTVYFAHKDIGELRLLFPDIGATADGEVLEASHVRRAFETIRQQTVLNRLWAASTDLGIAPGAGISDLRLDEGQSLVAMEVESSLGECTVRIHRGQSAKSFRYSLTDVASSVRYTPRVADALMSDFAEELGGYPEPETLLDAMIGTYARAQSDHEWFSM